jgi:hypothetical protein
LDKYRPTVVFLSVLLWYFPLNESFVESCQDIAFHNNTIPATQQWLNGKTVSTNGVAKGLYFGSGAVTIKNTGTFNYVSGQGLTIAGWWTLSAGTASLTLCAITNGTQAPVSIGTSGSSLFNSSFGGSGIGSSVPASSVANTWFFFAGVLNPWSTGRPTEQLFLNGNLIATGTNIGPASAPGSYFTIGGSNAGGIASCMAWNRALSQSELISLYKDPYCMLRGAPDRQMGYAYASASALWRRNLSLRTGDRSGTITRGGI